MHHIMMMILCLLLTRHNVNAETTIYSRHRILCYYITQLAA